KERVTVNGLELAAPPLFTPEAAEVLAAESAAWARSRDGAAEVVSSELRPMRAGFAYVAVVHSPAAPEGFPWAVRATFAIQGALVEVVGESAAAEGQKALEQMMRGVVLAAQV